MKKTIVILLALILAGPSALRADPQNDLKGKVVRISGTVNGLGIVLLYKAGYCLMVEDIDSFQRQTHNLKNQDYRLFILAENREAYLRMQADGLTPAETPVVVVKPVPAVSEDSHLPAIIGKKRKSWSGFSLGIGAGNLLSTWTYSDPYYNYVETSDFNFELQGVFNFAFTRIGISTGVISTSIINYLTFMVDFCLLPMWFFAPNSSFQLYLGVTIGNNEIRELLEDDFLSFSQHGLFHGFGLGPKFGMEYHLGKSVVLFSEGNYVNNPDIESRSYFNALIGIRYRFPFE